MMSKQERMLKPTYRELEGHVLVHIGQAAVKGRSKVKCEGLNASSSAAGMRLRMAFQNLTCSKKPEASSHAHAITERSATSLPFAHLALSAR